MGTDQLQFLKYYASLNTNYINNPFTPETIFF